MTSPAIVDSEIDPITSYIVGAGTDRLLCIIMRANGSSATSVVLGGQNFTKHSESALYTNPTSGTNSTRFSLWYMLESTLALLDSNHNITVTGGSSAGVYALWQIEDANQDDPFNAVDYIGYAEADTADTLSLTLTGSHAGDVICVAVRDFVWPESTATVNSETPLHETHNIGGTWGFDAAADDDTYTVEDYWNGSTDFFSSIVMAVVAVNAYVPPAPPTPVNMARGKATQVFDRVPPPSRPKKTRLAVLGTTGKSLRFNPKATEGATLGSDLRLPDGTIATVESLAELLGVSSGGGAATSTTVENPFDPDAEFGATQGSVLIRDVDGWVQLVPGTDGDVLTTHGAAADPTWETPAAGSVTSEALDDLFGTDDSDQGTIIFRGATGWTVLAPGTAGDILTTHGTSADPTWEAAPTPSTPGGADIFNFGLDYVMYTARFRH